MESSVGRIVRLAGRDDTQLADRRARAGLIGPIRARSAAPACDLAGRFARNGFLMSSSWSGPQIAPELRLVGGRRGIHRGTVPVGTTWAVPKRRLEPGRGADPSRRTGCSPRNG